MRSLFSILGLFIAETVDASLRRILGPFHTIGYCLGYLLGYTTSAFLSWRTCKLILGSFLTLPGAILILLLHETPHWLVKKGKLDDARYTLKKSEFGACSETKLDCRKSIMFYRGKDEGNWEKELQYIIDVAENRSRKVNTVSHCSHLQFVTSSDFLIPLRCVGILYMMFSVSGIYTIGTYTDTFMEV